MNSEGRVTSGTDLSTNRRMSTASLVNFMRRAFTLSDPDPVRSNT
jgi:hypothetical protein